MGDHKVFHEELLELEQSIQSKLDSVRNTRGGQGRTDTLNQCNEKIKKARQVLHQLRVEVRSIGNQSEQADFEKKTKAHEKQIAALNSLIGQLKNETPQADVEDPAAAGGNDRGRGAARKIAGNINTIQDDTIAQAQKAVGIVADTEDVAGQASRKLREQTEEMKNIKEDLRTLDGNVKRAKREMQAFMRRMMSDRLILVLMFLVLCGIIAMIAVRIVNKNKK